MSDLRQWLSKAEAMGELAVLRGVNWDLEIGVITELAGRQPGKPAVLFDEIPGYPSGHRVLANSIGSVGRFGMTMGFAPGMSLAEMVREWRRRSKELKLLPPRFADTGPVMENSMVGEEVDVLKLPVPKWHERDGGRYIGTGDAVITKGPNSDWVNLGTYRLMINDRNHLALSIGESHHGHLHMDEWHRRGEPMPVAVALGMDPLLFVIGATELPYGVGEYDYAGGLCGEPVDVVKGPITGLPIPAQAEIVLEGFVDPGVEGPEGPHGEYLGYYASGARVKPTVRVEAVYYRNEPIILGSPPLKPPDYAGLYYIEVLRAACLWDALEAAGVPNVAGVWPHVTRNSFLVVSVKQRYPGHAKQAARVVSMCSAGASVGRFTVVVDEDIDVTDLDEVLWAMCTRVDPDRDMELMKECTSAGLDPMVHPDRKKIATMARVIIDATRPYEWRDRFPEVVASSAELKQQVLSRWGEALKGIV